MQAAMDEHDQGAWKNSNEAIEQAFRLVANQPYIELGSTIGAALLSENLSDYKGDPHELVMLHTLGMLNYSFLGQWEEALVEARGANSLMAALEASGHPHVEDPLNRYFSSKLFERMGQWDDAYIDMVRARAAFRELAPISHVPEPSFLGGDLLRLAGKAGRREDLEFLKKEYPGQSGAELGPRQGEVWILVFDGLVFDKEPVMPLKINVGLSESWAPVELVYNPDLMGKDAAKAKNLGEGLRAFTRFSLVVGLAVLTQGQDMSGAVQLLTGGSGEAKRWKNVPAHVYACRLVCQAGPRVLGLKGRSFGGDVWEERVSVNVPEGKPGLLSLRIKDGARVVFLSPSLRPEKL
jgi:hypothetical protein